MTSILQADLKMTHTKLSDYITVSKKNSIDLFHRLNNIKSINVIAVIKLLLMLISLWSAQKICRQILRRVHCHTIKPNHIPDIR